MKGRLPDKIRLEHILDALKTIDSFIEGLTFDEFASDLKTTFAVVKALEIVGEAANHIAADTQALEPAIDWIAIIGLRHVLVHEYYGIRPEILWRIITTHTAELKPKIQAGPPVRLITQLTEP
jgi:uncharacterized protein with HEPN domain